METSQGLVKPALIHLQGVQELVVTFLLVRGKKASVYPYSNTDVKCLKIMIIKKIYKAVTLSVDVVGNWC